MVNLLKKIKNSKLVKNVNKKIKKIKNNKIVKSIIGKKKSKPTKQNNYSSYLPEKFVSSYETQIKPPTFSDTDTSITSNWDKVNSYLKTLVGTNTSIFKSNKPLGKVYFNLTGETCRDATAKGNKQVDRYTVINSFRSVNGGSILNSATADLNSVKNDLNAIKAEKPVIDCIPIEIKTIDASHTIRNESHYVALADIRQLPSTIFVKGKPNLDKYNKKKEGFVGDYENIMIERPNVNILEDMDNIQKFFIGSVGVLGLYLFYKLLKKH